MSPHDFCVELRTELCNCGIFETGQYYRLRDCFDCKQFQSTLSKYRILTDLLTYFKREKISIMILVVEFDLVKCCQKSVVVYPGVNVRP